MIRKHIFGRRAARPDQRNAQASRLPLRGSYGGDVEIDMDQVLTYSKAIAKHRGYPEESAATIARRVVFLERRGLPGLANLHREVFLFRDEPLTSRHKLRRPDGRKGGHCPFFAGIDLEPSFEQLTASPPENRRWVTAPSNGLLLVPKLAEWLRPTGRRAVFWWAKGEQVPGFIVVEGFRLEFRSTIEWDALDALQTADHIGFSDCPDDFAPTPNPRSGFCEKITLQPRHIALLDDYLKS